MRQRLLRRPSALALLLMLGLEFRPGSAHALAPERGGSPELQAARSAVERLLKLTERAESRRGGDLAIARRQAETSNAETTAAWLDWLPDFSAAVRRQVEQETDSDSSVSGWRLDFEGRLALSLRKLSATDTARAAQVKGQAELEQAAYATRQRTLEAGFELYFQERKIELLKDQISAFEPLLAMTRTPRPGLMTDGVLVEGYLAELQGTLSGLQLEQRDQAQRLGARLAVPLDESGIDPRLELPLLLELIRAELGQSSPHVAQVRRADTQLEEERLRWVERQAWYVPELRSTTLALLPRGSTPGSSAPRLTSVTTELALALRLRPGVPALQVAQRRAVDKSVFDHEQSRRRRERVEDEARARVGELSRLWPDESGIRAAAAQFDDTARRFARGERSVAELAAANRTLLGTQLAREALLRDAILAQITLYANDHTDLSPAAESRREALTPGEVDRRSVRAADSAAIVKGARAEAERAEQRARSERFVFSTALEAGVSLPLYKSEDVAAGNVRPELSLSGSGSLTTPVRELSVLARWSLDLRAGSASQRAFESESRLRTVQAELTKKRYQWAQIEARIELAQATKSVELSQRVSQLALESLRREQRWLEQGAASERDLRAAELTSHAAALERGKAQARLRSAQIRLASYLGTTRGTELTVNETPEALESWLMQNFIPQHRLLGFEADGRRRQAELETETARAQTEALERPTRGTTLTTQATQGLSGGAFSLTFALGVALGSTREPLQIARAAEREGAARGRLTSLERELDEQRARVEQHLDEANALLDAEKGIQQRLSSLLETVRAEQAAAPDVHQAIKQRQLGDLEASLLDSEKRRLEADEQRRSARLQALALGDAALASRSKSAPSGLADSERALVEQRAAVTVADAAAASTRDHLPLPVVSAFHLVGPFTVGSYDANRAIGPVTTKAWRGDLGLGLAFHLDESLGVISSRKLSNAADLERTRARKSAALDAIHELGRTWTARELERLSAEEEAEALHHLEGSVKPRFALGQVTVATVVQAQQQQAFARLRHSSDQSLLRTQHALLAALGAQVSNDALDEYQRRASAWVASDRAAVAATATNSEASASELAARSRSAAASSAVAESALRVVSPITGLVELRPALLETTSGSGESRETTKGHQLSWVLSLIVPFKPKEFGSLAIASARARESDEELGATARDARLVRQSLQARFTALRKDQAGATDRRVAAERALTELEDRLRAARAHATIDQVAPARQALFDARRAEALANGATLEAALLLRAIQENR
jgi:outer membrane efflux protein